MSRNNKILLIRFLPLIISAVSLLLIFFPEKAHAEPVYQVLKDNTGIGLSIRLIWKNVKDLVNYLVVAVLIAVAFAQILHVNINTYGIKKVLPALVLAVIGANLSFFVCRVLVDVGNVVLTLLLNPSTSIVTSSATPGTTLADAFRPLTRPEFQKLAKPENWSPAILFIKSLMLLVGAIMLYILAFLLFIRNWMIYFLIVLGPLAFMATVLPQTKALFTQWWNQFLKWTFMPIVSIFWLWLGAKWSNTAIVAGISDTGEGLTSGWFMKSVFAMVCFYLAIATPLKMGGPVMQQWAGLGKKAWKGTGGKVGDYWALRARNFGMRRVNEYKQYGLNLQRMGKNPISRFAGKHWLGTGMDKAQADKAHEEARAKGITEGLQARHYYRKGDRFQMEREYTKNREGEIGEFEKYAQERIYMQGPGSKPYQQIQEWRRASQLAKTRMASADNQVARFYTDAEKELFTTIPKLDMSKKEDRDKKKQLLKKYMLTEDEYDKFHIYYQNVGSRKLIGDMEGKKSRDDAIEDVLDERVAFTNAAQFQEMSDQLRRVVEKHKDTFHRYIGGEKDIISTLTEAEQKSIRDTSENMALLKKMAIDMRAVSREDIKTNEDMIKTVNLQRITSKAKKNYQAKVEQAQKIIQKNGGEIPVYHQDLVSKDALGNVSIHQLDPFEASRLRVWFDGKTAEKSRAWIGQYGLNAMGESLINGLAQENYTGQDIMAAHTKTALGDRTQKNKEKATRAYNTVIGAMVTGTTNERTQATEHYLKFINHGLTSDAGQAFRGDFALDVGDIGTRVLDEFKTDKARENLQRASGDILDLSTQIAKIKKDGGDLASPEHTELVSKFSTELSNAYKTSHTIPGGGNISTLLVNSILGEKARIGDSIN